MLKPKMKVAGVIRVKQMEGERLNELLLAPPFQKTPQPSCP